MKISTYPVYTEADDADFLGKTAIVIDLLRATSTITTVLHNGCSRVIPVEEVEDAIKAIDQLRESASVVSGGERDGAKLEGFDYGNSPLEYSESAIRDKILVLCTTNGTRAINKALHSDAVYLGCLNNARAVAKKAVAGGRDVIFLCAGTRRRFSTDDVVAAGAIISRMLEIAQSDEIKELDDLSQTALWLYESNRQDLHPLLHLSQPYRTLVDLDCLHDIHYCFQEDILDIVPCCAEGEIH